MKNIKRLLFAAALTATFFSCVEEYDVGYMPEKPDNVELDEFLNGYDLLPSYIDYNTNPNFKLGVSVTFDEFQKKEVGYSLRCSNFKELTTFNEMMHGSLVSADGSMDLSFLTSFMNDVKEAELSLYGRSLCWHANQNTAYLNSLLDSTVFSTPTSPNLLNKSGLIDASFNGWVQTNSGAGISIVEYAGEQSIKLVSSANSSTPESLRLSSPEITVEDGHEYEFVMFILSDSIGEGRIAFEGLINNNPEIDWTGSGTPSLTFLTKVGWNRISFRINEFTENNIKFHFDLGYRPNVSYFINVAGLTVVDLDSEVSNDDEIFIESEDAAEKGSTWQQFTDADASNEAYMLVPNDVANVNLTNTSEITDDDVLKYNFNVGTEGEYNLWVRAAPETDDFPNDDSFHCNFDDSTWTTFNNSVTSLEWTWYSIGSYLLISGDHVLTISRMEDGLKIDKIYLTQTLNIPTGKGIAPLASEEITLHVEEKEKETITANALENWISGILTACKDNITSWDVVMEPIDDENPENLRTGVDKKMSANEFYWQDYLGKDYAVLAFNLARKYGNSDDLLFINDNNLESNIDKCKGLINYVEYIEGKDAKIDGISTQMHISINSDKDKIAEMFQLLAATGKSIKISELDVALDDDVSIINATDEDYIAQADMYQYVVEKYFELIPANQRYGITIWSPVDTQQQPLGLWTRNYKRKRAYVGVADGLSK